MAVRIRFLVGTLFVACGLVSTITAESRAQIDLQEKFTGVPSARRQWEQKMLGRATPPRAALAQPAAYRTMSARQAGSARAMPARGVRQVAVTEGDLTPTEAARAAAQDVYMEPVTEFAPPEAIPPGAIVQGPASYSDGQCGWGGCGVAYEQFGTCDSCGPMEYGCGGGMACDTCTEEEVVGPLWWVGHPRYRGLLRDLTVFGGVHGFKGPLDQGRNGNFGFHEGINLGGPLGDPWGFSYQAGLNVVHSNFTGGDATDPGQDRNQVFFTGGIFRRQEIGFNSGVVFDYLNDSYYTNTHLKQVRTETSWRFPTGGELGYWGAYALDHDRVLDGRLDGTDQFAFYYRRHFQNGGDGRIWAGFSGKGDGLFGADIHVPIGYGWALENSINYLAPKHSRGEEGTLRESWGVNIQLVWYLGQPAQCGLRSVNRPLFSVADNSTFMADWVNNPSGL